MKNNDATINAIAAVIAKIITESQLSYTQMKNVLNAAMEEVDSKPVSYEIAN